MKNINRRNFLRLSATAGAGAILTPAVPVWATGKTTEPSRFQMRPLGKTGVMLPILSMGVMRADNPSVLRAAFNSGVVHFDTAQGYQNGKNEEMVGNFFKGKPRDSYFIATKGKPKYPLADDFEQTFTEAFEASLNRLQMDHVDIFYSHALQKEEEVKDERIINVLKKFKSEGKTRFIGFSTHANKPELIDAAIEAGIYDVILISYNFKLKNLKETDEAIERGAKAGIGFVAMKTMTGGTEDAEGKKKINAQACLKWAWNNKHFTTIIPGFTNYDELEECIAAAQQPELNDEDKKYLAGLKNQELLYCLNCEKCVDQCVEHLPIPDIMRAYMYNYGYKYPALSKETLHELALGETTCSSCSSCQITCTSGFNISGKIAAITPLLQVPDHFLV